MAFGKITRNTTGPTVLGESLNIASSVATAIGSKQLGTMLSSAANINRMAKFGIKGLPTTSALGSAISAVSTFSTNPGAITPNNLGSTIKNISVVLSNPVGSISKALGLSNSNLTSIRSNPLANNNRGALLHNRKLNARKLQYGSIAEHKSNTTDFVSKFGKTNFASMSKYVVLLPDVGDNLNSDIEMLAREVTLPSFVTTTIDDTRGGLVQKKARTHTEENMVIQFLIDDDRKVLKYFDDWNKNILINKKANIIGYHDDYSGDISVFELANDLTESSVIVFANAWPVSIGQVQLSYDSQNTISVVTISFTFDYSERFFSKI